MVRHEEPAAGHARGLGDGKGCRRLDPFHREARTDVLERRDCDQPFVELVERNDRVAFDAFIVAASDRALVLVDEVYREYGDLAGRSAVRYVRAGRNVLVFRTLAKIYGLAGLPIGYAIAPAALANAVGCKISRLPVAVLARG